MNYPVLIAFLLQQWLHERASVLRHTIMPVLLFINTVFVAYTLSKVIQNTRHLFIYLILFCTEITRSPRI